jgi:Fe-Mn family superoxide dismutase
MQKSTKFELPKLPYELNSLEPFISKKALEYHYEKHLHTYFTNFNNLVSETRFENTNLETIIKESDGPLYNNAAQVWNHSFYFSGLKKGIVAEPKGVIAETIKKSFGSYADFKDSFTKACVSLFGSGWVWLVKNQNGLVEIIQEGNAGNPIRRGLKPLLTCDIWEHSYYLDYQNRRADYVDAFWNIIDWDAVEKRF